MASDGEATENHPVLIREVIRGDGSRALALRVFCARQHGSVPLEACRACPSCIEISPDAESTSALVRCRAPETAEAEQPAEAPRAHDGPSEDILRVGSILRGVALCIGSEVDVSTLRAALAERGLPELLVVDDEGRLVGLVRDVNLPRALRPLHIASLLSALKSPDLRRVGDIMSTATSVGEDDSVRDAVLRMAHAHLREIPVITRGGELVGVLRDIDGLHSLSRFDVQGSRRQL